MDSLANELIQAITERGVYTKSEENCLKIATSSLHIIYKHINKYE